MSSGLGWVKMRGKKSMVLGCGCCVAEDHRDELRWKEAANEMRFANQDMYPTDGEYAYMAEMDRRSEDDEAVDPHTYAKYTWGAGLSEWRIAAILAQRRADYLKRRADIHDAIEAGMTLADIRNLSAA